MIPVLGISCITFYEGSRFTIESTFITVAGCKAKTKRRTVLIASVFLQYQIQTGQQVLRPGEGGT